MTDPAPRPVRRSILPRPVVLGLLVVLLSIAALAGPGRAAERARIEAFLKVTGFDVALDNIALSAEAAPRMLGIDPGAFGRQWQRLSAEVFDTKEMRALGLDILEQTLDDAALTHAAAFYATDLGQRLVAAENRSHMIEDDTAKQAAGARILADLRDSNPARIESLERMVGALDAEETSLRALQEVQFRFLMAASAAGVIELRADADELRAMLKRNEDALRAAIRASALAGAAYTYQGFSDAEIATYTEALEHPRMREVYTLLNAVQFEIMANRFEALAARLAELRRGRDI